jgi:hypothetical protein
MQVDHGGAGFGRANGGVGNFLGGNWQVRRHRRRMD